MVAAVESDEVKRIRATVLRWQFTKILQHLSERLLFEPSKKAHHCDCGGDLTTELAHVFRLSLTTLQVKKMVHSKKLTVR
jgi:hypothetical protein